MKILKKKKSRLDELNKNTVKAKKVQAPSQLGWLAQKPEEQKKMKAAAASMMKGRPPELWLFDNKPVKIRFRNSDPEGMIYTYTYQQGNRWNSVTAPAPGNVDLFARAGFMPSVKTIYEVVDVDGYVDKKTGKKVKNNARFFLVGKRLGDQIEAIRQKFGGLTKRPFEITRTGSGKTTSYMILPLDKEPYDYSKVKSIAADIPKWYAPPTEQEQRRILTVLGKLPDDSDDE